MKRFSLPFAALAVLLALPARAADPDSTGLVPTIWWDFETKPSASQLPGTNKGSASGFTFTSEGTATYVAGATNGWALDASKFTPYSSKNNLFSTAGGAFTLSLVMNLGSTQGGIALNLRNETEAKDLIVRRGSTAGSLVVGIGPQASASTVLLETTFADGDSAWHLVSVVFRDTGTELYVDGALADSTASATLWSASGGASRLQFGSHLGGLQANEARNGGCIDDLRIHDAALTTVQIRAVAAEYGLVHDDGFIGIAASGEPTVGADSFRTPFDLLLDQGDAAEVAIVHGADAALSAPATNVVGSALPAGSYTASLSGLASGTTYWWKLVASNGVKRAETDVASFRTLDTVAAADFSRRVPVAVSGYAGSSTLTNFPVLVKLAADAPSGFDYADCAADGSDLRFAAPDGLLLHHEIDTWNTNGESFVWVKVPALSGSATAFTMYYGASDPTALPTVDPRSVWTETGHRAVWHFAADATESAQGLVPSSTTGTPSYEYAGAVGPCWQSAGAAWLQYANDASWRTLGAGSTLTISVWAKFDDSKYEYQRILSTMSNWQNAAGYELTVQNQKNQITVGSSGRSQYQKVVSPGPMDELVYLTAVYNADRYADLYVNGVLQEHQQLNAVVQPTEAMTVACVAGGGNVWNGRLDELRLHAAAESADWVKACYDTMATPTSFAVLSPVESTDPDMPRIGEVSASDANGVATFTVPLAVPGYGGEVPTAVSVFYGTDGEHWTELSLGSTNETATLTGSASGFAAGVRYFWYAVATATSGGTPKTTTSSQRSFVARFFDPTGYYMSFTATVVWDGAPAENVPFPIRISETGIHGFDYDDVTASGLEILDEGGQLLPYEIDTWNTNGESLVWTRLPVYENGATVTVRYGAPFANAPLPATDVWSDYVGVWHLNDLDATASPYGSYSNSTATAGIDGEKAQASIAGEAGVFGKSVKICDAARHGTGFELGGVFVPDSGTASPLDLGDTFVLSGWVKHKDQDYYWDKLFAKRRKADNSAEPTGAFVVEIGSNGSEDKFSVFGGGNDYKSVFLNSTMRNAWSYLTFVYDGSSMTVYQNGVLCGSGTVEPVTDNDAPLCFGNMTSGYGNGEGESAWCGWIDEVRLADGVPSAAWIAAEYHAMADDAVSFSSVSSSDASASVLGVPSVASDANGSFTVSVAVSENDPASIVCTIDGTDHAMSTADASLPATYSATVSGLAPGTHVASVHATATSGTTVSATCPDAFHAGALAIAKLSDADESMLTPGVFRVSRADADSTGLPALTFDVAFSGAGLAAIADPGNSTATIPAGAAYVDISVAPIPNDAVNEDLELVLTVSGAHVGQSSTASLTVVNADFDLAVRYVSTTGNDDNSGGTPESPKKTIAAAVGALLPIAPSRTCTVHVAPGLYPISAKIVVTNAIRVVGDDPDPSKVLVSNKVEAGYYTQDQRVFQLNHPDALVANLTMQRGQEYGHGGNFHIGSAGGMVSNCVVEAGYTRDNGKAGGGWLDAGVVTHTIFRRNSTNSGSVWWNGVTEGVLHLGGNARAENCLFDDNSQWVTVTLVSVGSSAVLRNCSIVNSGLSATNADYSVWSALKIDAGATVRNVVIAGVTNTVDGLPCPPTGEVANFVNGAFDGDATDLPAGTVVGTAAEFFPHCAENVPYAARYRPKAGGPLYDKGADYEPMALYDLSGSQKRKVGAHVDIGCYEASGAGTVVIVK
jgi:hypothetical protein